MKLTCPELDPAGRARIAKALTDAVVQLNASPHVKSDDLREHCTVHFTPYSVDGFAIGGQMIRDRPHPDVTMEYSDWGMSRRRQRRLARELTVVLANLFQMNNHLDNVNIRFHPYPPSDFAVAGRLLSDMLPFIGRVMKRIAG